MHQILAADVAVKALISRFLWVALARFKTKAKGGYASNTQAQMEAARKIIASEVSKGSMSQGNITFKNSEEAQILLNWIKSLETSP